VLDFIAAVVAQIPMHRQKIVNFMEGTRTKRVAALGSEVAAPKPAPVQSPPKTRQISGSLGNAHPAGLGWSFASLTARPCNQGGTTCREKIKGTVGGQYGERPPSGYLKTCVNEKCPKGFGSGNGDILELAEIVNQTRQNGKIGQRHRKAI
jgi:hypothetical protein